GQKAQLAREAVHRLVRPGRDLRVVVGRIAADELGDEARLGRRKELLPDLGGAGRVALQDLLRRLDRPDRRSRDLRLRINKLLRGNQGGKGIVLPPPRPPPAPIQHPPAPPPSPPPP